MLGDLVKEEDEMDNFLNCDFEAFIISIWKVCLKV